MWKAIVVGGEPGPQGNRTLKAGDRIPVRPFRQFQIDPLSPPARSALSLAEFLGFLGWTYLPARAGKNPKIAVRIYNDNLPQIQSRHLILSVALIAS